MPTPKPAKSFTIRPNRKNQNYDVIGPDGQAVDSYTTREWALRLAYEYQTEQDDRDFSDRQNKGTAR